MSSYESLEEIESRDDLVAFIRDLIEDLRHAPDTWENTDLPSFLDALAAWTESMDGYFLNKGIRAPDQPTWRLIAQMLAAASIYE